MSVKFRLDTRLRIAVGEPLSAVDPACSGPQTSRPGKHIWSSYDETVGHGYGAAAWARLAGPWRRRQDGLLNPPRKARAYAGVPLREILARLGTGRWYETWSRMVSTGWPRCARRSRCFELRAAHWPFSLAPESTGRSVGPWSMAWCRIPVPLPGIPR